MKTNMILKSSVMTFDVTGNENETFIIEQWAQESLLVLEENMIAAQMVYRDYEDMVARHGETVTAWIPQEFVMKRKTDNDNVTKQAAKTTPVQVVLNQHLHVSFTIKDGEESKSFKTLRDEYLVPACRAIARGMDEIVLAQVYRFQANAVGQLLTTPSRATIVDAEVLMDSNKVPVEDRKLILSPKAKGSLLKIDDFVHAEKRGDGGEAMRRGEVGMVFGFDTYMAQNVPSVAAASVVGADENDAIIDSATGYGPSDTGLAQVLTISGADSGALTAAPQVGAWCTIVGDATPQRITAATTTSISILPGLRNAVVDNAVINIIQPAAVNNADAATELLANSIHAVEFNKGDGTATPTPVLGQMISDGANIYGLVAEVSATAMVLDIPLTEALADDDWIGIGPAGDYSLAFHKNAIALVTRPLATPAKGAGALSYVAKYNDLAMRVTITYNGESQGHLVTVDLLCGIKVLNEKLGCVIYS